MAAVSEWRGELARDSRGILDPGRMHEHVDFDRRPPSGVLVGLVQWFWVVRWSLPQGQEFVQPVLTHPSANLSVGMASSRGLDSDAVEATLVGVQTGLDRRRLRGEGWNVAAKLEPGALGAFIEQPAVAMTDRIAPLGEHLHLDAEALVARVSEAAPDVAAQIGALAEALTGVVATVDPGRRSRVAHAVDVASCIEHDRSVTSVAELAARTGCGVRSLQRLFRDHVGVSPLWTIRRHRLIDAADAARAGRPPSWSALAADLGYADQSHLARDFRATVGLTPSDYAASVVPLHPEGGDPPRRDGA